jgi:signal peptidase II
MAEEPRRARESLGGAAPAAPSPKPRHRPAPAQWLLFFGVAALVVAADQVTKRLIDALLPLYDSWPSEAWPIKITHISNTGAAFSILQDQSTFLIFTSIIGLGAILLFFFYPPLDHPLLRIALGLQLGGAIGNLIDRVAFGSVTDFIQFPHYPAFNVADSSIVIGVAILIWFLVFRDDRDRKPET